MGLVMTSENFITCLLALRRHGYSEEAKHLEAEHTRCQIENTCLCDAIARDQNALRNAGFEMVNGCDGPAWKPPLGPKRIVELEVLVETLQNEKNNVLEIAEKARVERDRLAEVLTAMVRRIDAGSGYWQNETMCHLKEQLPAARALLRLS